MYTLGISGLYHDSAAVLLKEDIIMAAAQEERFTRVKHDNSLPINAIRYCLDEAKISMWEVDEVIYYDNPLLTLDRYIHNIEALKGDSANYIIENKSEDVFLNRLKIDQMIRNKFGLIGKKDKLNVCEHHVSHAASAFYPSPFESSAILTIDGVGEWATVTIGRGNGNNLEILKELDYPHSLGLLYSAFTSFCGFKVNSGDYKFMGLAPYGEPIYYSLLKENLIDIKEDGSFRLNMEYFSFHKDKKMTSSKLAELLGGDPRKPESKITRREMDIAASVQKLTEEIILGLARYAKEITKEKNLVMAGGVALNCVANGKLLKEKIFENIWIQPAAGDAGGALGCAYYMIYQQKGMKRKVYKEDAQKGSYLGPEFKNEEIKKYLDNKGYSYVEKTDEELFADAAKFLDEGKVVGWFQGRMEFGPRALGNRSILGDPRSGKMQSVLNLKIKYRESFRPFAPSVLREDVSEFFEMAEESPYMLLCSNVKQDRRKVFNKEEFLNNYDDDMLPVVNAERSDIPAVTHIDFSARIQTVSKDTNTRYYELIKEFKKLTGYGIVINTSFNVRGEPIVCTPEDAYRCFMRTEMDVLVMGNYILYKEKQLSFEDDEDWRKNYVLD